MASDYTLWEQRKVVVDNLRLDPENPRIPSSAKTLRQNQIRDYLVANEDVRRIAKLIATDGFIPFEPIYVVKEGDLFTVLEGNRRTCALQLLRAPDKAPAQAQSFFNKLSNSIDINSFDKINVTIAPSRKELRKLLYLKHADESHKRWSRQQKHRFIAASLFDGKTIDEIAAEFDEQVANISEAVLEVLIQEAFKEIDLNPDTEEKAIDDNFPLSTVTRLVNCDSFKKYTGIKIEGSTLVSTLPSSVFKAILRKIVSDILDKKLTSRTIDKTKDRDDYVDTLKNITTDDESSDDPFAFTPGTRPPAKKDTERPTRPRTPTEKVISAAANYETGISKLDALIGQGKLIQLGQHNFAASLLLRTILELAVVRVFEINNKKQLAVNGKGRTNQLSTVLDELVKHEAWFTEKSYVDDLKKFCDKGNTQYISLETLNRYAHGPYTMPDREAVRNFWLIIEPLVAMCCKTPYVGP